MKTDIVYGIHAVNALLKNSRDNILELYVLRGRHDKRLHNLLSHCKGIPQSHKNRNELNDIATSEQHQGIIALIRADGDMKANMIPENDIENTLSALERAPLILILDGVTDPHNFGACLRSADAAGVDLVITPKDKSVGLTPVVRKVACGAAEVIPLCQVTNLARTIELLQKNDVWVYGAAGEADESLYNHKLTGGCAIVMGAEGPGMRRLTKEKCDYLFKIPMSGSVSSLNVSVATGVCLFEAARQRQ